jgi:hypothetical protein
MTDSKAPHTMAELVNPLKEFFTWKWVAACVLTLFLISVEFFSILVSIMISRWFLAFIFFFCILITITVFIVFARFPNVLEENVDKIKYSHQIRRGIITFSKYNKTVKKWVVRKFTGWIKTDEETGLCQYMTNQEMDWQFEKLSGKQPYNGNYGYNVLTYPMPGMSKTEYKKYVRLASNALTELNLSKKLIIISGENLTHYLNDIEEELKKPKIEEHRRHALESMLETFSDATTVIEYLYVIHIGLPLAPDKKKALENMQNVRAGYEKLLNESNIGTVLLKDEDDILSIVNGMLTGDMYFAERLNGGKLIPVENNKNIKNNDHNVYFWACADDIESDPEGNFVTINGRTEATSIVVGKRNRNISIQPIFSKDFSAFDVDEIVNIGKKEQTSIIWCHVEIPISEERHTEMFGTGFRRADQTAAGNKNNSMSSQNIAINKAAKKKLEENMDAVYNTGERYVWFAFFGIVLAKSREDAKSVLFEVEAKFKHRGVTTFRPRRAHLDTVRMTLLNNYIRTDFLQIVSSEVCSAFLPTMDSSFTDSKDGLIIARDSITKRPVRLNPSLRDQENLLCFAEPGTGKSVFANEIAGRAVDHNDMARIIGPKNEDRKDGTDYRTFVEAKKGQVVEFGRGKSSIGLFVIPFNKNWKKTWAFQYSADHHYDYAVKELEAGIKKQLTPGQRAVLITTMKKLYVERGILDAKGNVINTKSWSDKTKIKWPTFTEGKKMWDTTRKENGGIPDISMRTLYDVTASFNDGMNYGWVGTSNGRVEEECQLIYYDLSGLDDNLKEMHAIMVVEHLNLLYLPKDPDAPRMRVYVIWDEINELIKSEALFLGMEKGSRRSRFQRLTHCYFTQDPLLEAGKLKMLLANCKNLVLPTNLTDQNLPLYRSSLNLNEKLIPKLMTHKENTWMLISKGVEREIELKLTKFEETHLVAEGKKREKSEFVPATPSGIAVYNYAQRLLDVEGFFNEDDLTSNVKGDYTLDGYVFYNLQNPFGPGSENCWILKEQIKPATKAGNQDIIGPIGQKGVEGHKHYGMECLLFAWMNRHNFPDLVMNHHDLPDLTWLEGCIEIEIDGTHTLKELNDKVDRAEQAGCKFIIFTGDGDTCKKMRAMKPPAGADYVNKIKTYVIPQGGKLLRALEEIALRYVERKPEDLSRSESFLEQTEEEKVAVLNGTIVAHIV